MKKLFILFFSLVISNTLSINLNSNLELDGKIIIDRNLDDSEVSFPSQNFLIELKELKGTELVQPVFSMIKF